MPLIDQDGNEVEDGIYIRFPDGLNLSSILVKHNEVWAYDQKTVPSLYITKGNYPGAGISVEIGAHVNSLDNDDDD